MSNINHYFSLFIVVTVEMTLPFGSITNNNKKYYLLEEKDDGVKGRKNKNLPTANFQRAYVVMSLCVCMLLCRKKK